jgi:hypothetical protein
MRAPIIYLILFLFTAFQSRAQEDVITAGFQFKPIFSSKFFNTGKESQSVNGIDFSIEPRSGYCLGMVIRKGFTPTISLETGINYVRRNYSMTLDVDSMPFVEDNFKIIGYEIPVQGLVFIQLSDKIYMDVAMGVSLDFYPSDILTLGEYWGHSSDRKNWYSSAIIANLGWEYRTESSGYFYLGASYHRPFNFIYRSFIRYPNIGAVNTETSFDLQGNYLTFDVRYFFHSDPQKRKKTVRKR